MDRTNPEWITAQTKLEKCVHIAFMGSFTFTCQVFTGRVSTTDGTEIRIGLQHQNPNSYVSRIRFAQHDVAIGIRKRYNVFIDHPIPLYMYFHLFVDSCRFTLLHSINTLMSVQSTIPFHRIFCGTLLFQTLPVNQ